MKATIGLEIHLALATKEKLFSSTKNDISEQQSTMFSFFDCATPGTLPVLSKEPVDMAIAFGLAVGADVRQVSYFERKHYFYPDLPLGYQITQQNKPILWGGIIKLSDSTIYIEHAHLECDAAKSIHMGDSTYIDIFRAASPLLEIVSTPCMHSAKEASSYAKAIHELGMFLGICDGKLEEGSFRVDASVSISDSDKLGTRVEVKNISSFNFLEKAIEYEIERQHAVIASGHKVIMETRLFQESDMTTHSMRKKETVDEYRYLMDPDIPALVISEEMIKSVKEKYSIYFFEMKDYLYKNLTPFGITDIDLKNHGDMWKTYYENKELQTEKIAKIIHYWLKPGKKLNVQDLKDLETLGAKECKDVIEQYTGIGDIKALFPQQSSMDDIVPIIEETLKQFPQQIEKYKSGEIKIFQFLMGQCIKALKGKSSVDVVKDILVEKLK